MTKPLRMQHFDACIRWWGGRDRENRTESDVAWRVTAAQIKDRGYNLDARNPNGFRFLMVMAAIAFGYASDE